jgi:hypothetical protein
MNKQMGKGGDTPPTPDAALDDENGDCKRCGHPFNPHVIIAYDLSDFSMGGKMQCPVEGCSCLSDISFDFKQS